jgi:hypothetical protein
LNNYPRLAPWAIIFRASGAAKYAAGFEKRPLIRTQNKTALRRGPEGGD